MPKKESKKQDGPSSTGDSRFANFESDPRFRLPSKSRTKTTIDKRFSRMLKDDDFVASAKVDKYGRKLKSDNKKKALQNIYQAEDDEDAEVDEDHVVERELEKANTNYDPARGGGFSSSESESEDEDEDEEDEEAEEAEAATSGSMQRLRDAQADVETGEVTRRIAVVNLDWDHIKSADLLALFSSFVPKGGRIERVSIYPSEFGKERMQREELEGPPKEIFKKASESQDEESEPDSEDGSDNEEDDEKIKNDILQEGNDQDFDSDALRAYQLDRLRYYYAVMVCSDTATAEKIYMATDGTEYQSSSNFMDLRFIPDDVTFDDEPRDECDSISPDYKPTEFTTDALQHSKVKLTWDIHPEETTRREEIKRAFSGSRADIEENDLRAYLASDNSDDDDDDAQSEEEAEEQEEAADDQPKLTKKELKARKLREALGLSAEPLSRRPKSGPVGDMQVTFSAALMDDGKKKKVPDAEETTLEKYKRKERERKARKKEKVLAKREGASGQTDDPEVEQSEDDLGFDDPFFTTDEPVKKSKHTEKKEERRKRREAKEAEAAENAAQKAQLEQLMAEDSKDAADHLDHFDMNEISRAEKLKSKKHKKGKKGVEDHGGLQEGFEMDVKDDRFKAVFDSHEFAIDPSNPRYKATPGMKQLLEERRKKRKTDPDAGDGQQRQNNKTKKQRR
ncbi:hypothetical protein F5Y11DRAFT_335371 [Daldinia sp. FL1419]|nr:hypothetical protein F5Y11DRAFT_335371 [Daldinia sp. FL1419]